MNSVQFQKIPERHEKNIFTELEQPPPCYIPLWLLHCQTPARGPRGHRSITQAACMVQGLPGAFPASLRSPVHTRSKATACIYPVRGSSSPIPFRDSFVVRIELVSEGPKLKRHCTSQASLCWGDLGSGWASSSSQLHARTGFQEETQRCAGKQDLLRG